MAKLGSTRTTEVLLGLVIILGVLGLWYLVVWAVVTVAT